MKNWNWKKGIGIALSAFVLFGTATGLTGCETGGEETEQGGEESGGEQDD